MFSDLTAQYSEAAGIVVIATAVGLVLDLVVRGGIGSLAHGRGWRVTETVMRSLRWMPTLAGALIGTRVAVGRLGLPGSTVNGIAAGLKVVAVLGVTWAAAALSGRLVRLYTERDESIPASTIFVNLARGLAIAIGLLLALDFAGVSIAPLVAALGVGGIAIGLALQPTLENLFSGVQVLMSKQVLPGDFVRLETGEEGWVHDVTWRNTTIQTVTNDLVIVPNSTIGKSLVTNFTSMDERHSVVVPTSVSYNSDLDHVEKVAREVATVVTHEMECGVDDFEPIVRFSSFGDSGIDMVIVVRATAYADRLPLQHELIKRIHARFAEEGIEIPFPQRVVHTTGADGSVTERE